MSFQLSFPRYLLSKQSVDDRALNKDVFAALRAALPPGNLRIIEVGGGMGTMIPRLLRWGLLQQAEYCLVDESAENADAARAWLPFQLAESGLRAERSAPGQVWAADPQREVKIDIHAADVFDFIQSNPPPADVLIAHAFLDLLAMPVALEKLFTLLKPGGLAWLTINFDGVTTFEPPLDPALDARLERLYHASMDSRPTGGDSQSGRHLFGHVRGLGAEIVAAGASDWVVYAQNGQYPADEAYFLGCILHFFESSLAGQPGLAGWLATRRAQVERGELVYIAHQMDFLLKKRDSS